jgi:uncharacterized protein YbaR (Trm112 family)
MIDPKLLDLIRCPVDGQPLMQANKMVVLAINQCIQRGELRDASDGLVEESIDGALVTIDGVRGHAIRSGIPTLIPGEAFALPDSVRSLLEMTTKQP